MKYRKVIFILSLLCFIGSFASGASGVYVGKLKGFPFVRKQFGWSIGIYTGESPFNFTFPKNMKNPVLTAKDVTDVPAEFAADPFMVKNDSGWYMFFEVMNAQTDQGDIGLAISNDGLNWAYERIVLDESFHLSYPYVFKWKNEYYMIPESHQAYSIRLYKAVVFPTRWSYIKTLIRRDCADSSILCYNNKWWIFTAGRNDVLCLYYANRLMARSIADMGLHEFRRQLGYKAEMRGNYIKIVDRWFQSSKRCSRCHIINDSITLSNRVFKCKHCGLGIDRDFNAAINLMSTVSSTGFKACREKGAGSKRKVLSETSLNEAGTKPCTDLYTF